MSLQTVRVARSNPTLADGDVYLHEPAAQAWAAVHIFLSVSWLANLIGRGQAAVLRRGFDLQRHKAHKTQLSPDLITALDRKGTGEIDKLDFVVGMLIAIGATVCDEKLSFATHVEPLVRRFEALDADGSGSLTKEVRPLTTTTRPP